MVRPELLLVALAFLVSGAAGLIYQVAWQRILALHSGVGIYSIVMIVGAFMAGLGVGSHAGGALSLRLGARGSLRAFAAIELAIGAFGAVSCWLYYDVLYLQASWLYSPAWRAGLLHFAGLFLPTFLMGTSLPFLVRAMVLDPGTAGRTIGVLYGINLLGAAIGSVLTPWVLVRLWGIREAVTVAAWGNVAAGALALLAGWMVARRPTPADPAAPVEPGAAPLARRPLSLWAGLYALSGFMALALEILWFRVLEMAVKSTAFTFGTLLGYYLLGAAVGCFIGARSAHRVARPLRLFLLLQCVIAGWAALGAIVIGRGGPGWPLYRWYLDYWSEGWFMLGWNWRLDRFAYLYVVLPVLLFAVPTILMGLSFPVLQRAVHDDVATTGRKVGLLQAANIAGCVAGSLLVGLVLLDVVGTTGTFRLLCLVGAVFAAVGIRHEDRRFAIAAAALVVLAAAIPSQRAFWLRLHGVPGESDALLEEDASGVGAILPRPEGRWAVFVHGKSHSSVPFGGGHTQLGAVPAMVHPAPASVAVIGLGSGDTAWAMASRTVTRSLTVFEISGTQPRLLRGLAARADFPDLRRLLDDPRLRLRIADGRVALEQEGRLYDVIEADAQWPAAPYSGNLYSVEFFQRCMRRLAPGGILCTWSPTPRVYASFTQAAPYIVGTPDRDILIGSNEPIALDHEGWRARALSEEVRAYLGDGAARNVADVLATLRPLHVRRRRQRAEDINHDLFPRDEFATP